MKTLRLLRPLGAIFAGLTLISAAPVSAALRTYRATWSGASFGNTAQAVATLEIDDASLPIPGFSNMSIGAPGAAVTRFDVTVFGSPTGNGTWTSSDFSSYTVTITDPLNLFTDWVGQPQPSSGTTWGDTGAGSHDFNVFANTAGAPGGVSRFMLRTNSGGSGHLMRLTSFAPVSAEGARVAVGDTVNLDLTTLIQAPPGLDPGQTVRVLGLPAGLRYEPATAGDAGPPMVPATPHRITGTVLGLAQPSGVKIQILQGARILRTLPYNIAVAPYPLAGGFEALLLDPSQITATSSHASTGGVSIPFSGNATPFPSVITLGHSPLGPPVAMRVRIQGFNHTFPDDVDVHLMAPDGRVVTLFSDAGSSIDAVNLNLSFSDAATSALPDSGAMLEGTYLPFNHEGGPDGPLPGMVGNPGGSLNALAVAGTKGDWRLFVFDDAGGDLGSIASWSLEFDHAEPAGKLQVSVASPTLRNPNPAYSATLERLGHPRRSGRGSFTSTGSPQTVTVDFPKLGALDASSYHLVLIPGSDLMSGAQAGAAPGNLVASGFRLARPGRIPGGNPALTLSLPPVSAGDRTTLPGGIGHASGTVKAQALIPLKGLLGDAQAFTTTLNLSQTNQAVVWLTPYKNKTSALGGILNLGDLGIPGRGASLQSAAAFLRWNRAADASAPSYPAGFGPLSLGANVSRWNPASQAEALSQSLGLQFRALFARYFAPPDGVLPVDWLLRDNFSLHSPFTAPSFTGKVSGKTGAFNGVLGLPAPAQKSSFSGVLLQDASFGSLVGHGLVRIPVAGPGLVKGSFQTSGIQLSH